MEKLINLVICDVISNNRKNVICVYKTFSIVGGSLLSNFSRFNVSATGCKINEVLYYKVWQAIYKQVFC
ncbi:hypothetical protein EHRUM3_11720 [Ehrlichia ruminantium]|uniref:Uncharacterized protein n=1 Tax=Ehrlichia ruminantium TaxID=779 RepID=A0A170TKT7_EHRRU|nr:hypothetical protein EHRUM3_11720 [Ehrlichia ruminantium]